MLNIHAITTVEMISNPKSKYNIPLNIANILFAVFVNMFAYKLSNSTCELYLPYKNTTIIEYIEGNTMAGRVECRTSLVK